MILEEVISEFHELGIPETRERELNLPANMDVAVVLFGLRRVGKTHLLYNTMEKLLQSGLPIERIFYVNFEDERLEGLTAGDLSALVELYYKLNPDADVMYLFLDEVQEVQGWEKFVRRLLERKRARVFVTGSSSKFLSREIATSLRGRSLSFQLFPLSFREFLSFKGFDHSRPLTEARRGRLKRFLEEYVRYGGFPGIVSYPELIKIRTLQEYLDLIIYRDLIERYGIEKTGAMKALIRVTVRNFARKLSIRKLNGLLASSGVRLSRPTTSEYFSYLEDVGFVIPVRKYHPSDVESLRSTSKIYIADTGFVSVFGVGDLGHRIENIVAVELLRRKHYYDPLLEVRYWDDGKGEVDFVLLRGLKVVELIQVSYDVEEPTTMDRELKALLRASKSLNCKNLTVITWDYEDVRQVEEKTVKFVPLWRWLLS
ncbi:ATP-binding protein [Thermococcus barossii]|uniref:ATPase n=1 Tax=Thermococcus barossii TaxID=54077 RepID=A0A2Z2MGN4_9EURY|nr:ATP-binding protein [Thermococcus barossii]ASJ04843.1 ATPase [Thermococcus barossii]